MTTWRNPPLPAGTWPDLERNPLPYAGLVTSLPEEHHYACRVQGELPAVSGTLYRVGPGRYDRGPDRKRMVLDGDGMVQALTLDGRSARYRNRYVRTRKYVDEEAAGRFLHPTFSTHGSGPLHHNLGLRLANQANTTVLEWAGSVWAFDEGQIPYRMTRELETVGEEPPDARQARARYWAHWKLDAAHAQVHLLSIEQGPRTFARVVTLGADGAIVARRRIALPRPVYFHDWFVSERHFAFLLHPAYISPLGLLRVVIARETFSEALQWRPERGSVLLVADRESGDTFTVDVSPCWMWHAINAFEADGELVCDFIANEAGGDLGTDTTPLFQIMRGEVPDLSVRPENSIRRYRVDLATHRVEETVVAGAGNVELPSISATERGRPYGKAYMIEAGHGEIFPRSLCEFDARTLETRTLSFGPDRFCSEPVLLDTVDGPRARYLATQIYDARRRKSDFALVDLDAFEAGPVATIELEHHVPVSFHGFWSSASVG